MANVRFGSVTLCRMESETISRVETSPFIPFFRLPSRGAWVDCVFASILACKAASEALNAFADPPNLSHRSLFCTSFGEPWNLGPMDFSCESWKGLFEGFSPVWIPSPPRSVVTGLVMAWRRRVARPGVGVLSVTRATASVFANWQHRRERSIVNVNSVNYVN